MNMEDLSERLQIVIQNAVQLAVSNSNPEITTSHMLKAVLKDDTCDGLLKECDIDKNQMEAIVDRHLKQIAVVSSYNQPALSYEVNKTLVDAQVYARNLGDKYLSVSKIGRAHV